MSTVFNTATTPQPLFSFGLVSSTSLANSIIRPPSSGSVLPYRQPSRRSHSSSSHPHRSTSADQCRSSSTRPTTNPLSRSNKFRSKSTSAMHRHTSSFVPTRPSRGSSSIASGGGGLVYGQPLSTSTTTHSGVNHCSALQPDDSYSFISPYVKYSLFLFNLIFWIIGATLIALGVWSLLEEYDYNLFRFQNVFDFLLHISLTLLLTGFVIFSMSFTGCLGALRENICLIKLYSLMLLLLFIGEVILSTLAFIFPSTLVHFLKERLSKDLVTKYREDTNLQNLIDIVQMEFRCCGISDHGYKDWSKNIYFNCTTTNPSSERCAVPFSCCRDFNTELIDIMCGHNMQNLSSVVEVNKYVYTRGCVEAISELVERNMNMVAIICLGSALAQLFAMFLARSLQGQIFAQRARWM